MKIAAIRPIPPWRGGVCHSNTLLCNNLSKKHEVFCYSFSSLYPKWLYPGKEIKKESKIVMNFKPKYMLNSLNPFSWIKTFREIKKNKPDLVILQWMILFLAPMSITLLFLLRRAKIKTCLIAANVTQHERRSVDDFITKFVFRRADYIITLSEGDMKKLKRIMPDAKAKVLLEPTFESLFPWKKSDAERIKKELKLKKNVVMMFGLMRRYKGLKYMLDAMPIALKEVDFDLLVVGEFWHDKEDYMKQIDELKIKDNVKIVDKYVADEEVPLYFSMADIIALPYTDASQSALIQTAYGYDKPSVVSDFDALTEFVDDNKDGFVVPSKDSKALANSIIRFYKENKKENFKKAIAEKKKLFQWSKEKEDILFFGIR